MIVTEAAVSVPNTHRTENVRHGGS